MITWHFDVVEILSLEKFLRKNLMTLSGASVAAFQRWGSSYGWFLL